VKLTIEPTNIIENIDGHPCRRWEGTSDGGTPVHVWVRMLTARTHDEAALAVFDRELQEVKVARELVAFDYRMVSD